MCYRGKNQFIKIGGTRVEQTSQNFMDGVKIVGKEIGCVKHKVKKASFMTTSGNCINHPSKDLSSI